MVLQSSPLRQIARTISKNGIETLDSLRIHVESQMLKDKLLKRQEIDNIDRIEKILNTLDVSRYGIKLQDKSEITKCLYPTKFAKLRLRNERCYSNKQLEILGRNLLSLQVDEAFLKLFKRSQDDVANHDFNFSEKMKHMSSWKKHPIILIRNFLKWNNIAPVARLAIPESRIPPRIRSVYDQKSFNAIIGYLFVTHDREVIESFVKGRIAKDVIRYILLR